jgi:hypothetical protein
MKYFQVFGLLGFAVMAWMAFASIASADYVTTSTGGSAETPTLHLVDDSSHVTFSNVIANISCKSTAEGSISSHGAGSSASGSFSSFAFTGCTNSWHVTVENVNGGFGAFWIDHTSGHNGTFSSMWTRINATRFGITCVYETFLTQLGTLTGGNPATLDIQASIPLDAEASSGLCGSGNAAWEGAYITTSALYVAS